MKVVTIGDINIDWIIDVNSIDDPIKLLWSEAKSISTRLGGGGVIFSVRRDVGFESHLIGKVGNDSFGTFARDTLEKKQVLTHISVNSKMDTGKVLIIKDTADQKAMISHRGANTSLAPDELDMRLIKGCGLLYVSGYALLEQPQSTSALIAVRMAKENGVFTMLDVVPHRVFSLQIPHEYQECMKLVDSIVLELGTARKMLGIPNGNHDLIINELLSSYQLVLLRTDNDTEIVAYRDVREVRNTGYSQASYKVGYLDRFTALTLRDFLKQGVADGHLHSLHP